MIDIEREVRDMIGLLATSKAGHDKNQIYLIVEETQEAVYLVNGLHRKIGNPKKKNKKHIQVIKSNKIEEIKQKIAENSISDDYVKHIIKEYSKSENVIEKERVNQEV